MEGWAWSQFLRWAGSPGGIPAIVGVVLSLVVEYVPGWSGLLPKWKRAAFFCCCLAVPLLAAVLGVLTDGWAAAWGETFWPALLAGGIAFGAGTLAHLPRLPGVPRE